MFSHSSIANALKKSILFLGSTIPLMLFTRIALAADSEDLASSLMPSIASTFGSGSTVLKVIYLIEFIAAVAGFIATRKPTVFLGIIAISLFVNLGLKHFVGI